MTIEGSSMLSCNFFPTNTRDKTILVNKNLNLNLNNIHRDSISDIFQPILNYLETIELL